MKLVRMPIEQESPEQFGYERIKYNLTESSVRDRSLSDLGVTIKDELLCYDDHLGKKSLRAAVALVCGGIDEEDVLVTPGAAAALFFIAMTTLERGDHIVVVRPNYATNIETPRMFECDISYYDLVFEEKFQVSTKKLQTLLRPETKLISLTFPHNPSGASISADGLKSILELAESHGIRVLVDETYREMASEQVLPSAASLSPMAVAVSSLSKTYGVPGIRIGWVASTDKDFMYKLLCAKEQVTICGSVLDEAVALKVLEQREAWLPENNALIADHLSVVEAWIEGDDRFEWVRPVGGCVCFPRIREDIKVDIDRFYEILNDKYGTYVGPGHWFEQSKRYFRVGYAWPQREELSQGLSCLSKALSDATSE